MDESTNLLRSVLDNLKTEVKDDAYSELFADLSKVHKTERGFIFVVVKNALIKFRLEQFYLNRMNEILNTLTETKMMFKFILEEDIEQSKGVFKDDPQETKRMREISLRPLKPEYTFNNFVIGTSNRFAASQALQIAESPYAVLNPLYIFGEVGLGKTHLMTAIGHFVLDNDINKNVVYTTAQQFTEDYFYYTNIPKGKAEIETFYNYYRSADVLLVDDIQFLDGKASTQEEFFKVFDYLHSHNKQIVLTSDRPAKSLKNMMSRLVTRFSWGLAVEIGAPDDALRLGILKKKLKSFVSNPELVEEDALIEISSIFTVNIRELEGALKRFISYCVSFDLPFNKENVKVALDGILPDDNKEEASDDAEMEKIKSIVAKYFGISTSDLSSSSRKNKIAYARHVFVYLVKTKHDTPLTTIGKALGNRDHATIAHSFQKIKDLLISNPLTKQDIDNLNKLIE